MDFTKQELETLAYALHDRESRMLDDMEAYRNQHNREAQMDCRDEYKKAATLNDRVHAELDKIETEEQEKEMIEFVVSVGEDEGESHRLWLDELNGVCNICGHTDILSAVVCKNTAGEDCISFQINTGDDNSTIFESFGVFDKTTRKKIFKRVMTPIV